MDMYCVIARARERATSSQQRQVELMISQYTNTIHRIVQKHLAQPIHWPVPGSIVRGCFHAHRHPCKKQTRSLTHTLSLDHHKAKHRSHRSYTEKEEEKKRGGRWPKPLTWKPLRHTSFLVCTSTCERYISTCSPGWDHLCVCVCSVCIDGGGGVVVVVMVVKQIVYCMYAFVYSVWRSNWQL